MVQLKKAFVGYDSNKYNNRYRTKIPEMQIDENHEIVEIAPGVDNYSIAKKNNAVIMQSIYSKVSKFQTEKQSNELNGSTETTKSAFKTLNNLTKSNDSSKPLDTPMNKSRNVSLEFKNRLHMSNKTIIKASSTTNYGAQQFLGLSKIKLENSLVQHSIMRKSAAVFKDGKF